MGSKWGCGLVGGPRANDGGRAYRSPYDVARDETDWFPSYFYLEYLNNATVQEAIGTPINYTQSSSYVYRAFDSSE